MTKVWGHKPLWLCQLLHAGMREQKARSQVSTKKLGPKEAKVQLLRFCTPWLWGSNILIFQSRALPDFWLCKQQALGFHPVSLQVGEDEF